MSGTWERWRLRVVDLLPTSLMAYPFEAFCALYGSLAGLVVLLVPEGVPDSMREALPGAVIRLFGATLLVAGGTVAVGLWARFRLALPIGLRLLGFSLGTFALGAAWTESSWKAAPSVALVLFIAALAFARSLYLRATAEAKHRARTGEG